MLICNETHEQEGKIKKTNKEGTNKTHEQVEANKMHDQKVVTDTQTFEFFTFIIKG